MVEAEGIPPTASVASVGEGIRYIGDWIYCYSGPYAASTAATKVIDFTSGAGLVVAEYQFSGYVDDDNAGERSAGLSVLYFNELKVFVLSAGQQNIGDFMVRAQILIPPFTHIKVDIESDSNSGDHWGSVAIVGRVYGAE